jgi:hypothetical protein
MLILLITQLIVVLEEDPGESGSVPENETMCVLVSTFGDGMVMMKELQ